MPAHPKESNKDKVTRILKSRFKVGVLMGILYMKFRDGEAGEKAGGGEGESGREGEILRRGDTRTRREGGMGVWV